MQLWFPVVIPLDQINIKVAEFQSFSCAVVYILFLFRELDLGVSNPSPPFMSYATI